VFLIDLVTDPLESDSLVEAVPDLVARCRDLKPRAIILLKTTVYDAAYEVLKGEVLPVVNERIPFPGSGQQRKFEEAHWRWVPPTAGS
jgi:hypothetical protein